MKLRGVLEETNAQLKPILKPDQVKNLQTTRDNAIRERLKETRCDG